MPSGHEGVLSQTCHEVSQTRFPTAVHVPVQASPRQPRSRHQACCEMCRAVQTHSRGSGAQAEAGASHRSGQVELAQTVPSEGIGAALVHDHLRAVLLDHLQYGSTLRQVNAS